MEGNVLRQSMPLRRIADLDANNTMTTTKPTTDALHASKYQQVWWEPQNEPNRKLLALDAKKVEEVRISRESLLREMVQYNDLIEDETEECHQWSLEREKLQQLTRTRLRRDRVLKMILFIMTRMFR